MEKQLEQIAKSYDQGIDWGRQGIDAYHHLPEFITGDPDYPKYRAAADSGQEGSERKEIKDFLG